MVWNKIKDLFQYFLIRFELLEIMRASGMNIQSATGSAGQYNMFAFQHFPNCRYLKTLTIWPCFVFSSGPGGKKNRQKERRLMKGFISKAQQKVLHTLNKNQKILFDFSIFQGWFSPRLCHLYPAILKFLLGDDFHQRFTNISKHLNISTNWSRNIKLFFILKSKLFKGVENRRGSDISLRPRAPQRGAGGMDRVKISWWWWSYIKIMMMMIIIYEDHADDLKTFLLFCLLFSIDCSDHQVRSIVRWQKGVRAKKIQVKAWNTLQWWTNFVKRLQKLRKKKPKYDLNSLFASQRKRGQRRKRKGILGSRGFKFNQVARRCRLCA